MRRERKSEIKEYIKSNNMNAFTLKFCCPTEDMLCRILGAASKLVGEPGLFLC